MTRTRKTKIRLKTHKEREEELRLRFAFPAAMAKADRGNTEELRNYLMSKDPLTAEHREALADLIYRYIQRKGRGRPRGSDPSPRAMAKSVWVGIVKGRERQWHRAHPGCTLPKGMRKSLIQQVGDQLGDEDFFYGIEPIDPDEIHKALARGKKRNLQVIEV